jgi:hypothetical protein
MVREVPFDNMRQSANKRAGSEVNSSFLKPREL